MRLNSTTLLSLLGATSLLAPTVATRAAVIGTDNAGASAYADSWDYGDDGTVTGDAFGAWRLFDSSADGGFAGRFVASDTNVGAKAFGMYAGRGDTDADNDGQIDGSAESTAYRDFNGGGLTVGQTFSVDLSVNFRNGYKGIDIRDGIEGVDDRQTIFNFNTGGDDYVVSNAATGNGSIGNAYSSDTVFNIALSQTSLTGGTWTITRTGGESDTDSGTYSGVPTGFKLYVGNTDGGSPNDLLANNLSVSVVPEPASLGLLGLAGLLAARRRR